MSDDLDTMPAPTAEQAAAAEKLIAALRIKQAATEAIVASGSACIRLLLPHVEQRLRVVSGSVVAIDAAGHPRFGARGVLGAREIVSELKATPPFSSCW